MWVIGHQQVRISKCACTAYSLCLLLYLTFAVEFQPVDVNLTSHPYSFSCLYKELVWPLWICV